MVTCRCVHFQLAHIASKSLVISFSCLLSVVSELRSAVSLSTCAPQLQRTPVTASHACTPSSKRKISGAFNPCLASSHFKIKRNQINNRSYSLHSPRGRKSEPLSGIGYPTRPTKFKIGLGNMQRCSCRAEMAAEISSSLSHLGCFQLWPEPTPWHDQEGILVSLYSTIFSRWDNLFNTSHLNASRDQKSLRQKPPVVMYELHAWFTIKVWHRPVLQPNLLTCAQPAERGRLRGQRTPSWPLYRKLVVHGLD